MISTLSQHTSVISVSVGREVRVRESQQPEKVDSTRAIAKNDVEPQDLVKLENTQDSRPGPEAIDEILNRLQEKFQHAEPRIEFSIDKELDRVIIRLIDKQSGDLVRQIPSEEALKLDRFFADQSGLFVEEKI